MAQEAQAREAQTRLMQVAAPMAVLLHRVPCPAWRAHRRVVAREVLAHEVSGREALQAPEAQ
jgi:hypothetical protein